VVEVAPNEVASTVFIIFYLLVCAGRNRFVAGI